MLQTTNFFMGSEIFRRHSRMILQNDEKFTSFFITQTLKPDSIRDLTVEEQYNLTLPLFKNALEIFDISHVAVELQNNGNIHYHTIATIHKDKLQDEYNEMLKLKSQFYLKSNQEALMLPYEGFTAKLRKLFWKKELFEKLGKEFTIFDYVNHRYRHGLNKQYFDAYNEISNEATDIRSCYRGSSDLVSYMHKDIDKTYKICDKIKFTIFHKFNLENLQRLVSFKHIK